MENKITLSKKISLNLFILFFFPFIIQAQIQNALDFDGIDDQVITSNASSLITGSTQLSITCWVYPENANPVFPDFDGFCGFRNDVDADFYIVQIGPNSVEARFRNSNGIAADIVYAGMDLNTWNHFVFTYDGMQTRLYHNGEIVDSISASGMILNSNENFYIGNLPYSVNNYQLTGLMDEVSLWNNSLSISDISCLYHGGINPVSNGLLLYYTFNQGTSGGLNTGISTLQDLSGHLDGSINGMALIGTTSNFVGGTSTYTVTSATLCPGGSYQFGTQTLSAAGSYMEGFPGAGCDSIVQLILSAGPLVTTVTINNETLMADQGGATYQWLDCNNGYLPILNETGQSYHPMLNGSYAVLVTSGLCSDTSICYTMTSVGISEADKLDKVSVYPNPFKNRFSILLAPGSEVVEISIYNNLGKLIQTIPGHDKNEIQLETESWRPGVYFLRMNEGGINSVRSLVKEQ